MALGGDVSGESKCGFPFQSTNHEVKDESILKARDKAVWAVNRREGGSGCCAQSMPSPQRETTRKQSGLILKTRDKAGWVVNRREGGSGKV